MHVYAHTWEHNLLSLALEGRQIREAVSISMPPLFDAELLERAYAYCESVTALHSRSFHMASSLLPIDKRRAVRALYAFCRMTDDIVDADVEKKGISIEPVLVGEQGAIELQAWREKLQRYASGEHPLRLQGEPPTEMIHKKVTSYESFGPDDLIAIAWTDARIRYDVPPHYVEQLIDGVAQDLHLVRYASFEELTSYCYGVASTVGLMSMHIIGFVGQEAIPYAIKLGVALQLTNILRDIAEDWQANRLYLPEDELTLFNLSTDELSAYLTTPAGKHLQTSLPWQEFMRFQIERNRQLYEEAWPGVYMLDTDGRFAIAAAAELYRGILDDIEAHDYDIFTHRAHVTAWGKVSRLPSIWWRSRFQQRR